MSPASGGDGVGAAGSGPSHRRTHVARGLSRLGAGALLLALLAGVMTSLLTQSGTALSTYRAGAVFSNHWDVAAGIFQGLPLLAGTLITGGIAVVLATPVAVGAALCTSELCPPAAARRLSWAIDALAAVPSVVWGLWALRFLAPKLLGTERWVARTVSFIPWLGGGASGVTPTNVFVAGVVLAIMIVPVICARSGDALAAVPAARRDAARALGATRWEVIRLGVLPTTGRPIAAAALFGLVRAMGETMAVVLVIGDSPVIARHAFWPGYSLAAAIANELGDAAGPHRSALFAAGLSLLLLTGLVSLGARGLSGRPPWGADMSTFSLAPVSARRRRRDRLMRGLLVLLTLLALLPLVLVLSQLLRQGRSAIGTGFFSTDPTGSFLGGVGGVRSAVLGSLEITLMATLVSAPIGIGVGRLLVSRTPTSRLARGTGAAVAQLAAVPPIVFGLFVYATLVLAGVGGGYAGWKGALAVALLMLAPIVHASSRAECRGDVLAGVLGAAAWGIGEAAPLRFTAAGPGALTFNPAHPMNSLGVQIFIDIASPRPEVVRQAWAPA